MRKIQTIMVLTLVLFVMSCSKGKLEEKGFQVSSITNNGENNPTYGINKDSLKFESRPSEVLLTGVANIRITTIYKVNYNKDENTSFIGSNNFHGNYDESNLTAKNNWHNNIIPGFNAVYGYNMVNISHYDIKGGKQKNFFENPVLIWNVYYPSFLIDTLNFNPILRDYFIVSVYNYDSNKDGFINLKDLRHLYLFNINGEKQKALIPENYSVFKSEYDSDNDFLYIFAQLDKNGNGKRDEGEPIHIFWIDLKDPNKTAQMY